MQLGNILSTASDPVVGKPVKFRVLGEKDGRQVSAQAEAVLAFVDEDKRQEHKRLAREWLESHDYKGKSVPMDVLVEEEYLWFVLAALKNKDDPSQQFCLNKDYATFRRAVVMEQVVWLKSRYDAFLRDEYPELATPQQQEDLLNQAAGN